MEVTLSQRSIGSFARVIAFVCCTVNAGLGMTSFAAAQDPGELRLIRHGEYLSQISWMDERDVHEISKKAHQGGACAGYMDITDFQNKLLRDTPLIEVLPEVMEYAGPSQRELVTPMLDELSLQNIRETVGHLSSYRNRYYKSAEGVAAAHWIEGKFREFAAGRADISVNVFNHRFEQPSVVARLEGKGPRAHEVIVVGGHEDSINQGFRSDGPAPGADDNASGVATVLEIFRVLAQSGYQPSRTIEFMTYAGEEKGLLGSQDIAENYRNEQKSVVGVMQFDMTMFPGANGDVTFITDFTNAALTQFSRILLDSYVQHPWVNSRCGYACSDHASWTDAGYPSVFPFEAPESEMNRSIHTPRDTLTKLNPEFGMHFAKLGVAFAVELAEAGQ